MASRETRKKEIAICICHKQVDISNCISVFFLWIIIELSVRIHEDGFVSSLGDRQVFVSVGLYMKDGQISWVSFHICHVSLHFLKWKITALSKTKMQNYDGRPDMQVLLIQWAWKISLYPHAWSSHFQILGGWPCDEQWLSSLSGLCHS